MNLLRFSFVMAVAISLLISISASLPIVSASADSNGVNVCCATQHVSYNPGAASKYHSPISSMGLLAVEGTFKGVSSTNLGPSSPAGANVSSQGVPVGLTRFINDSSYVPQSETTIAVDPSNSSHVVGGYNDGRWFFCTLLRASDCPNGYAKSVTGFTVSTNGGRSVAKSNDLPGVLAPETNASSGKTSQRFILSWGDPWLDPAPNGNFYFASLAIDPVTGANGIMIEISNSNLWSSSNGCVSSLSTPAVNPCWTSHFIFGNLTYICPVAHLCGTTTLEDKDAMAVDTNPSSPNFGDAYVAWDHFYANGQSASFAAVCTPTLSCTMISGGVASIVSGTDKFAGNATPAVAADGTVYLSWCNFGTATAYGPVYCNVKSSPAGGASFGTLHTMLSYMGTGTELPGDSVIIGFATEQFRTASVPTLVAGSGGDVYYSVPMCTSGFYYRIQNSTTLPSDNPGNCGLSGIFFTHSSDNGVDWSTPAQVSSPAVVIQPTLTFDPKTSTLVLAYYTTQFDPLNHRIDVVALVSKDKGTTFTLIRATQESNEPDSDPAMYNYIAPNGFGGSFIVPQYGDYFTAWAYGGKVWILFTGNYAKVQGTQKASPFLAVVGEAPSSLVLGTNSKDAPPGATVSYSAAGFTGGSQLSLTLNWNGITVSLANVTVSSTGQAAGTFVVPNLQSQIYQVAAQDGLGLTSAASLGVGQVSLSPIQNELNSIQNSINTLQGTVGSLSTSLGNDFSSLNATVNSARNSLTGTISGVASDISSNLAGSSSKLSLVEYLAVIAVVLLILVVVLEMRKGRGPKMTAPLTPSFP